MTSRKSFLEKSIPHCLIAAITMVVIFSNHGEGAISQMDVSQKMFEAVTSVDGKTSFQKVEEFKKELNAAN